MTYKKIHQPRTAAVQCDYNISIYNVNIGATLQPKSSSDFTTADFYNW